MSQNWGMNDHSVGVAENEILSFEVLFFSFPLFSLFLFAFSFFSLSLFSFSFVMDLLLFWRFPFFPLMPNDHQRQQTIIFPS